jgi:hypothetical protein
MSLQVSRWTVDFNDGQVREVRLPHAWRQTVDVRFEGPVTYKTLIDVPVRPSKLRFHGVSYQAEIFIDDVLVATHLGMWDAFDVSLAAHRGRRVEVDVKVTKNGGDRFPVNKTVSGFLPYLHQTFGGLVRPVEIVDEDVPLTIPPGGSRYSVDGKTIFCEGKSFYLRGILHEGWYPELGHCHPGSDAIEKEIEYIRSCGFNTVAFGHWMPPHSYLIALESAGMHAWLMLPLVSPNEAVIGSAQLEAELEAIVKQYAHHPNIVAWTLGTELGNAPGEWVDRWVKKIAALTGSPLVEADGKGSFDAIDARCEQAQMGVLLDAVSIGAKKPKPILMSSCAEFEVHRDLAQIAETMPFWASGMGELNDPGVRLRNDLPSLVRTSPFAQDPENSGHVQLMASSAYESLLARKSTIEAIRGRADVSGYVLSHVRDTPIKSAGLLTDWGRIRFEASDLKSWNNDDILFLIPASELIRVEDLLTIKHQSFEDIEANVATKIRIGIASVNGASGAVIWKVLDSNGSILNEGVGELETVESNVPSQVIELETIFPEGKCKLDVSFGECRNTWTIQAK